MPFGVQDHGEEEAIERATDGEDGDCDEHTNCISSLMIVEAEGLTTRLSFLALEVGAGVGDGSFALIHINACLLHESLPELLLLLASLADTSYGGVEPLRELAEEGHEIGDWPGRRDLRNKFTSILAVGCSRFWGAIAKTSRDTTAEAVGKREVVFGVDQELIEESLGFVRDVAVVLLVEAGCEDGVGEFALITPMFWKGDQFWVLRMFRMSCLPS